MPSYHPAFKEEAGISPLLEIIPSCELNALDVLVVDDYSGDGASRSTAAVSVADLRMEPIFDECGEHGPAFCYRTGFRHAL